MARTEDDNYYFTQATKREIQKCLHCRYDECTNCLERHYKNYKERIVIEVEPLVSMYNEGYPMNAIAKEIGVNVDTLITRLKHYGLRVAKPRPVISKATFLDLPENKRQFITWKGERLA